jgi:uncharacterized tellurite resistance protein B-like protein
MFGWLKSFVGDARLQKFDDTDCRLATAALLTRVATVNSEMSEARRKKLHAVLKLCFGLDNLTTAQLIHDAASADRSAVATISPASSMMFSTMKVASESLK